MGPGTVVLTGSQPNNYSGITRLFGGYLIAEKDQAFGTGAGGVYLLAGGYLTQSIGLRAPAGTTGFNYATAETGLGGMNLAGYSNDLLEEGLLQNFSGDNSYAGDVMLSNGTTGTNGANVFVVPVQIGVAANSSLTISVRAGTCDRACRVRRRRGLRQ